MRYSKRKYYLGRLKQCLSFFAPLIKGDEKIVAAARVYFYRNKNTIKTKLNRANHSPKLKLLVHKYPNLNNDDIKFFEELILLVIEKE